MSQGVYADPFAQFGSLDFSDFDDDVERNERKTWPPPGTATLVIEEKVEPLFISMTWTLKASVDGTLIAESSISRKPHNRSFIDWWARQQIKLRYELLRQMGVDAEREYVRYGGSIDDLRS